MIRGYDVNLETHNRFKSICVEKGLKLGPEVEKLLKEWIKKNE
jgi:hypothetical protein